MKRRGYVVDGGSLAYWVSDKVAPDAAWLVFLPGLTADRRLFAVQTAYFESAEAAVRVNCLVWDPPAHGESRPFPLSFSLDDMACMVHDVLRREGVRRFVLVGQSMGGYVAQSYCDLFPGEATGFVSVDSAPLKREYSRAWEVRLLRHTRVMYECVPWKMLLVWGSKGVAATAQGQACMREMMLGYTKREYCALAAHGYRILADAMASGRPYDIGCPTLLLCGEKDAAGSVRRYNKVWAKGESLPLVWLEGSGHNATSDVPDVVNRLIETFLKDNSLA